MRERIRGIIRLTCREHGVHVEKGVLSKDHVHMFISVPSHLAISKVMRRIKGHSSYKPQREFGDYFFGDRDDQEWEGELGDYGRTFPLSDVSPI